MSRYRGTWPPIKLEQFPELPVAVVAEAVVQELAGGGGEGGEERGGPMPLEVMGHGPGPAGVSGRDGWAALQGPVDLSSKQSTTFRSGGSKSERN
jgi:hypothetical protein